MKTESKRISIANSINSIYQDAHAAGCAILEAAATMEDITAYNHDLKGSKISRISLAAATTSYNIFHAALFTAWLPINLARILALKALGQDQSLPLNTNYPTDVPPLPLSAIITNSPEIYEDYGYSQALTFSFTDENGTQYCGVHDFMPEEQPGLSFQKGDRVTLHGYFNFINVSPEPPVLHLSHFTYQQPSESINPNFAP